MMFPCFDVKRTVQFVSVNDTHSLYYVFTFWACTFLHPLVARYNF
jgi:hypothetical protein